MHENERRLYSETYDGLHTSDGVKKLLRDWNKLHNDAYGGSDYDALVMLLDLKTAIERATLTDKQREVLSLVYVEDMLQEDVAADMGIEQNTVSGYVNNAANKIATIYGEWAEYERVQDETIR
jgi:DNA-directed RNA polymerase specialized sigma24 family protein